MEEKTKKKRVQKRAVRKKAKATESVSVAATPAVTAEAKKPRKSSKAKSSSSKAKSSANTPKLIVHLPTFEQVQLRAYFISERRRKLGLPGDESHDWLAAEQELREELKV